MTDAAVAFAWVVAFAGLMGFALVWVASLVGDALR
jgi:hypothetical protein